MRTTRLIGWCVAAMMLAGPASARTYTLRQAVGDAVTLSDAVAAAEAASDRA